MERKTSGILYWNETNNEEKQWINVNISVELTMRLVSGQNGLFLGNKWSLCLG
jgi:hypothetical protein